MGGFLLDSPMSWGSNEVQTAVDSAVRHLAPVHPGLRVQVVFKLAVYVVNDRLPAALSKWQGLKGLTHNLCRVKVLVLFTSCCCQQHHQTPECQQWWAAAGHPPPLPGPLTVPPEKGTKWKCPLISFGFNTDNQSKSSTWIYLNVQGDIFCFS